MHRILAVNYNKLRGSIKAKNRHLSIAENILFLYFSFGLFCFINLDNLLY